MSRIKTIIETIQWLKRQPQTAEVKREIQILQQMLDGTDTE